MTPRCKKLRIGIVGCGAIGSRMARAIEDTFKKDCRLTALYDINEHTASKLAKSLSRRNIIKSSLSKVISSCDFVVEAVNSQDAKKIAYQTLKSGKSILVMSVGQILNSPELFTLALRKKSAFLIPSGAICGLDAIKAASQLNFSHITLTTRKPLSGLAQSSYLDEKGITLKEVDSEMMIYEGDVDTAVQLFPKNINVAATLALASQAKDKIQIRILTSPDYTTNSHEIEACGDFGKIICRTENLPCPDNPKTSYLAVLSAIQTLRQFFKLTKIGT